MIEVIANRHPVFLHFAVALLVITGFSVSTIVTLVEGG